jgi:trehalose/maltose hydrolase-like predicted phosphorylase
MAIASAETAKGASDADIFPVFPLSYSAADAGDAALGARGLSGRGYATARCWASRMRVEADGRAHIDRVIGPDESNEPVDDNAIVMARWNRRRAAIALAGPLIDTLQPEANPAALLRLNGAPRPRGAASAVAVAEA